MTKSRNINRPKTAWTDDMVATLTARYPHEKTLSISEFLGVTLSGAYQKAAKLGLKKSPEYLASEDACRLRRGGNIGAQYRFAKGNQPFNKGRKGISYPGCAATQFKAGQHPHTWTPIGTDRLSKEGYLQVKLTDTGITRHDYVAVHHLVWELHHGDIPDGYRVTFKDRNKQNITPANLELVSIADMMRRNTRHNYPKELSDLIQLRGAINRKINRRLKHDDAK